MSSTNRWRMLAIVLIFTSLAIALCSCAQAPLVVRPAVPLPAPKVAVPAFLRQCPVTPSWYPLATCKPAQPPLVTP